MVSKPHEDEVADLDDPNPAADSNSENALGMIDDNANENKDESAGDTEEGTPVDKADNKEEGTPVGKTDDVQSYQTIQDEVLELLRHMQTDFQSSSIDLLTKSTP